MTKVLPPPVNEPVVEQDGVATLPWVLFFNQLFDGDTGTVWDPEWVNLTTVGDPTYNAVYYRIGSFVFFRITILPDVNTSAVAGSTYIENFPLNFNADGACFVVSGGLGGGIGHVVSSTNRIFVPSWTSVAVPLTVIGFAEGK